MGIALIVVLDRFSRSLRRSTPAAFAQDPAAPVPALEGLANDHYAARAAPWARIAFTQPPGHAEGADHLERVDRLIGLRKEIAARSPKRCGRHTARSSHGARDVRRVIAGFGRHPHRNAIPGGHRPARDQE